MTYMGWPSLFSKNPPGWLTMALVSQPSTSWFLSPLYHHLPHRTPIKGGHIWRFPEKLGYPIQSSILWFLWIRIFMDFPLFWPFRSSSDKGVPPRRHGNVPICSTCSCSVCTERRSKGKTQLRNSREIQEPCAPSTALRDAFGKTMEDLQKT